MKVTKLKKTIIDNIESVLMLVLPFVNAMIMLISLLLCTQAETPKKQLAFLIVLRIFEVVFVLEAIFAVMFIAFIGVNLMQKYAAQLIDYEDDDAVEDVWVDKEKFHIAYHEGSAKEITEEDLKFDTYKIKRKIRKDLEKPVFYIENGRVRKVLIPFTAEDTTWHQYNVK